MSSLESDNMPAVQPNDSLIVISYVPLSSCIPNWTTFVKEFFPLIISLESDKMTALWPDDSLTFPFNLWISLSQTI